MNGTPTLPAGRGALTTVPGDGGIHRVPDASVIP